MAKKKPITMRRQAQDQAHIYELFENCFEMNIVYHFNLKVLYCCIKYVWVSLGSAFPNPFQSSRPSALYFKKK